MYLENKDVHSLHSLNPERVEEWILRFEDEKERADFYQGLDATFEGLLAADDDEERNMRINELVALFLINPDFIQKDTRKPLLEKLVEFLSKFNKLPNFELTVENLRQLPHSSLENNSSLLRALGFNLIRINVLVNRSYSFELITNCVMEVLLVIENEWENQVIDGKTQDEFNGLLSSFLLLISSHIMEIGYPSSNSMKICCNFFLKAIEVCLRYSAPLENWKQIVDTCEIFLDERDDRFSKEPKDVFDKYWVLVTEELIKNLADEQNFRGDNLVETAENKEFKGACLKLLCLISNALKFEFSRISSIYYLFSQRKELIFEQILLPNLLDEENERKQLKEEALSYLKDMNDLYRPLRRDDHKFLCQVILEAMVDTLDGFASYCFSLVLSSLENAIVHGKTGSFTRDQIICLVFSILTPLSYVLKGRADQEKKVLGLVTTYARELFEMRQSDLVATKICFFIQFNPELLARKTKNNNSLKDPPTQLELLSSFFLFGCLRPDSSDGLKLVVLDTLKEICNETDSCIDTYLAEFRNKLFDVLEIGLKFDGQHLFDFTTIYRLHAKLGNSTDAEVACIANKIADKIANDKSNHPEESCPNNFLIKIEFLISLFGSHALTLMIWSQISEKFQALLRNFTFSDDLEYALFNLICASLKRIPAGFEEIVLNFFKGKAVQNNLEALQVLLRYGQNNYFTNSEYNFQILEILATELAEENRMEEDDLLNEESESQLPGILYEFLRVVGHSFSVESLSQLKSQTFNAALPVLIATLPTQAIVAYSGSALGLSFTEVLLKSPIMSCGEQKAFECLATCFYNLMRHHFKCSPPLFSSEAVYSIFKKWIDKMDLLQEKLKLKSNNQDTQADEEEEDEINPDGGCLESAKEAQHSQKSPEISELKTNKSDKMNLLKMLFQELRKDWCCDWHRLLVKMKLTNERDLLDKILSFQSFETKKDFLNVPIIKHRRIVSVKKGVL